MKFVFVHGWGFDASFWQPLLRSLSYKNCDVVDFGYFDSEMCLPDFEEAIYVTHSLGTMWALKNRADHMKALIAVSGFGLFQNFVDARVLESMQKNLGRSAEKQMQEFWSMCGMTPEQENLNVEALQEGLSFLCEGDESETLKNLSVPVLSLAGEQDKVTSLKKMKQEWSGFDLRICADGGHVLPQSHVSWCAEEITGFINEL